MWCGLLTLEVIKGIVMLFVSLIMLYLLSSEFDVKKIPISTHHLCLNYWTAHTLANNHFSVGKILHKLSASTPCSWYIFIESMIIYAYILVKIRLKIYLNWISLGCLITPHWGWDACPHWCHYRESFLSSEQRLVKQMQTHCTGEAWDLAHWEDSEESLWKHSRTNFQERWRTWREWWVWNYKI